MTKPGTHGTDDEIVYKPAKHLEPKGFDGNHLGRLTCCPYRRLDTTDVSSTSCISFLCVIALLTTRVATADSRNAKYHNFDGGRPPCTQHAMKKTTYVVNAKSRHRRRRSTQYATQTPKTAP